MKRQIQITLSRTYDNWSPHASRHFTYYQRQRSSLRQYTQTIRNRAMQNHQAAPALRSGLLWSPPCRAEPRLRHSVPAASWMINLFGIFHRVFNFIILMKKLFQRKILPLTVRPVCTEELLFHRYCRQEPGRGQSRQADFLPDRYPEVTLNGRAK